MSTFNYDTLNKTELNWLVDKFEALAKGSDKSDLVEALKERDLTSDEVKGALKIRRDQIQQSHPNHEEPRIQKDDDVLLIRMRRANPSYEYRRYTFTQEHPYVLMPLGDANDLLKLETGFVIATPEEAKEFYGRN